MTRLVLALFLVAASARADLAAQLDAIAAKHFQANEPGAAVLVRKDGKTYLRKAYGRADLELNVPLSPDHVFRIGSVTKQFTAVAILQLVQQGKLSLSDDVTKLLPGYPAPTQRVTLEHLLTHTSGIPSYTSVPSFRGITRKDHTPSELIALFKDLPLEFTPGTRFSYNNSAYILLGAILERASGMTYAAYLQNHLFAPAGMKRTRYDENDAVILGRAHGYARDGQRWINAPYLSMTIPFAAGGIVSTVDDLAKWVEALRGGKLVDPKLLARAQTAFTLRDGTSTRYGYGWAVFEHEGERVVQHGGGIHGFQSDLLTIPEENLTVIVLQNANREPAPELLAIELAGAAIGKPYAPKAIAMTRAQLERYAGTYRIDEQRTIRMTVEGDHLMMQSTRGPSFALYPLSDADFFAREYPLRIRFTLQNGKATRFVNAGRGTAEAAVRAVP